MLRDARVGGIGVRIQPGQTAFARTPWGPSLTASVRVSITSPAFDAL